jgi:S-adenosylmethionine synthetase
MQDDCRRSFTSESVRRGHPDKICDRISDAVLDEILMHDKNARVACETMVANDTVMIVGEISSSYKFDAERVARDTIRSLGYNKSELGFCFDSCVVLSSFNKQSNDIARGVDKSSDLGAGDQGTVFGFACNDTKQFMPLPIVLAHDIVKSIDSDCENKISYLRPDGKAQVTVEYFDGVPIRVAAIVISVQHDPIIQRNTIERDVVDIILQRSEIAKLIDDKTKIFINPTGRFVIGGPVGDAGLTGRKIIVDTYGGYARHGGGAFSGKDATKVDRCGAYMARYVAKNIVAMGIANKCEVQVSYAIGLSVPISISVNTFNTIQSKKFNDERLSQIIKDKFDFRPAAIIDMFNLCRPIYTQISCYGHFGRSDLELPWENVNDSFL